MEKTKLILFQILISIGVCYIWFSAFTIKTQAQFNILLTLSSLTLITTGLLLYLKKNLLDVYRIFLKITLYSTVMVVLFLIWNYLFRFYSDSHDFNGNIFRGIFYGYRAPLYGRLHINMPFDQYKIPLIASVVYVLFSIFSYNYLDRKNWRKVFVFFFAGLVIAFGWQNNFADTFNILNCHYQSFADDLPLFERTNFIIGTYTDKMAWMEVHNNHYPPGNLLILKLESIFKIPFAKPLVFLALIASYWPFRRVLSHYQFTEKAQNISLLLYGCQGALLFYPKIAMTPLIVPLSIFTFYFILTAFHKKLILYSTIAGVLISIYVFISFSVFLLVLFFGIFVLISLLRKDVAFKTASLSSIIIFFTTFIIHAIIFALSGYNTLEALENAIVNNSNQMGYYSFDVMRYLLTSTGNFISYSAILGLPVVGLFAFGILNMKNLLHPKIFTLGISLIVTLVIFSFSNQFYLEVERIWIFMTPFYLIFAGSVLSKLNKRTPNFYSILFIIMSISLTFLLGVTINHCV